MSAKRKGSAKERELANVLWQHGCAVLRGCSSGAGVRRRYVPDIVAICNGHTLVFEVKYRAKASALRLEDEKVRRLSEFAKRARGRAFLLVKFGREPWRVLELGDGRVAVEDYRGAMELKAFLAALFSHSLDQYL